MKEYLNRKTLVKAGSFILAVILSTFGLVQVLDYYQVEHPFKDPLVFTLFSLLIITIACFIFYYTETKSKKVNVINALHGELQQLFKNGEYQAILRRRKNFSRSLWVEGKPIERIKLGKIAEEAASRIGDKKSQAGILIDDLGWTSVTMNEYSDAVYYIKHGLEIAKSIEDYYWIAKAYRHLSGIEVEGKDFESAQVLINYAIEAANKIDDARLKNEMLAGIYYGLSILSLSNKKFDEAEDYLEKSEKLRLIVGDVSRIVKIYSLKGKIAEAKGEFNKAKDLFREGFEEAKKIGRADEMIRNQLGLSRIFDVEKNTTESKKYLSQAQKLLEHTPIPYKINLKEIKLQQLKK